MGRLAFVHQGTVGVGSELGKVAFRGGLRLGTGGVKEVEHGKHVVLPGVPVQGVRAEDCLIAHGIEPAAHVVGNVHQCADGVVYVVRSIAVSIGDFDFFAHGGINPGVRQLPGIIQIHGNGDGMAVRFPEGIQAAVDHRELFSKRWVKPLYLGHRLHLVAVSWRLGEKRVDVHIRIPAVEGGFIPPDAFRQIHTHPAGLIGKALQRVRCVCPHRFHSLFGQGKTPIVKVVRCADEEVRAASPAQVFVHVEAADKRDQQIQQNDGQGQRHHHERRLLFISA